jgi:tyrosyl-tRNA synthetase
MPLLVGLDGVEKMSKSKGNYVGITDAPDEMFGKLMSISDDLMWTYYTLLSSLSIEAFTALKAECASGRNPRDAKVGLAAEMVARFHGKAASEAAREAFDARFSRGVLDVDALPQVNVAGAPIAIAQLLRQAGLAASGSEAMRNLEQGGVRIDGEKVSDKGLKLAAGSYVVQVGKRRAARVVVS